MTPEEIDGSGWLRPLTNREILGICLLHRANCLKNMQRFPDEIATLRQAAGYLPDTALMKRVLEKNIELAKNFHAANRWDELWAEVENLPLPGSGPKSGHFWNKKMQIQFFMTQSTDLAVMEQAVTSLKNELTAYRRQIYDHPSEIASADTEAPSVGGRFGPIPQDYRGTQERRMRLPQERVPYEYWTGIPVDLYRRLQALTSERDVIEEMQIYAVEEFNLRNLQVRLSQRAPGQSFTGHPGINAPSGFFPASPSPTSGGPQFPPRPQDPRANLNYPNDSGSRRIQADREVHDSDSAQQEWRSALEAVNARRRILAAEFSHQPSLLIEIIPTAVESPQGPITPNRSLPKPNLSTPTSGTVNPP
jgi:hypothetical protein